MNEAIKHLGPRPDKEIIQELRERRIQLEKAIDHLTSKAMELDPRSQEYRTLMTQRAWLQREYDNQFIHDEYASEHGEEILFDKPKSRWIDNSKKVEETMRAKFVNEAIKHLTGHSHEELYKKNARKFRLAAFKRELSKYTKENLEADLDMDDYETLPNWHIIDSGYYGSIGSEIGRFIDKFYPFNDHPDNDEYWIDGFPSAGEDFHPTIVKIIEDWLAREFPDWGEDEIATFWEEIASYMMYYR